MGTADTCTHLPAAQVRRNAHSRRFYDQRKLKRRGCRLRNRTAVRSRSNGKTPCHTRTLGFPDRWTGGLFGLAVRYTCP